MVSARAYLLISRQSKARRQPVSHKQGRKPQTNNLGGKKQAASKQVIYFSSKKGVLGAIKIMFAFCAKACALCRDKTAETLVALASS